MFQQSPSENYQKPVLSTRREFTPSEREELITKHLSKVKFIADRMAAKLPPSVEKDDLYGAGIIGLIDAVERFDESRGISFTTFAEKRVRGAILDSLRALDWATRSLRRRSKEIQKAYEEIEQKKGEAANDEEVAKHLNMSIPEFHKALQEIRGLTVLDLDGSENENGQNLINTIRGKDASPLEQFEETERRKVLTKAIEQLPEKEHKVIALYYVEELSMKEIGAVLDVSESRISQIRTQAIIRLRANIAKQI